MNPLNAHKIYFLGIGGIGMSALARYFHLAGKIVAGYDRTASRVTDSLEQLGIEVFFDPNPARLADYECIIYTPAIKPGHPEFDWATAHEVPMYKRAKVLGMISREYKTIAVAGTHGKTTTSSMLTHVLRENGVDVTAFLGGIATNLNSNFVYGKSEWLVVEADEYDRSFLHLQPEWVIITSLDADHLDIYGTVEEMQATYLKFAGQARHRLLHESVAKSAWDLTATSYGEEAEIRCEDIHTEGLKSSFTFRYEGEELKLNLSMPGKHNVANMTAALALARKVGLRDAEGLAAAVSSFSGIYRRFELQYHSAELTYIDDYAHHPSELAAILTTGRELFPDRKLVVVFQPHLFTRTRDFMESFAMELSAADTVLLLDIYPARELPIPGISAEALQEKMTETVTEIVAKEDLLTVLKAHVQQPTILFSLGAGDIDREVPRISEWTKTLSLTHN